MITFNYRDLQNVNEIEVYYNTILLGDIYKEVDGFFVFSFNCDLRREGFWTEYVFLTIGNKLKELNNEWNEQIEEYFQNEL